MFKLAASPQKVAAFLKGLSGNGKNGRFIISLFGLPWLCEVTWEELRLLLTRAKETGEPMEMRVFVEIDNNSLMKATGGDFHALVGDA